MAGQNSTTSSIDLNGKRYNAKTGTPIGGITVMDGIINPSSKSAHKPAATSASHTPRHHTAKPVAHHRTEHSKTLMRHTVHKPRSTAPVAIKPTTPLLDNHNARRLLHAKRTGQSQLIARFAPQTSGIVKRSESLAVKDPPKIDAPIGRHHDAPILASLPFAAAPAQPEDIFSAALNKATSHKQPKTKRASHVRRSARKLHIRGRAVNVVTSSLIVLALGGFIALQNVPNIQMRLAARQAGMHASLPGYRPSGYSFAGIKGVPGQVSVSFHSNSDDRAFHITQSASNWDSNALRDAYLASGNQLSQTQEVNGKTVYLYGDSNATWVDGGIWYQVQGNAGLGTSQLLKIAASF